jgi:hypothetical protein
VTNNFDEHRSGTYKEPFTRIQYGVFAISSKDGSTKFIGTGVTPEVAIMNATNYYNETNADNSEMDSFFVRSRSVTYGVWEDEK